MYDEARIHPINHPHFKYRLNKMKNGEVAGSMLCSNVTAITEYIIHLVAVGQFCPIKPNSDGLVD